MNKILIVILSLNFASSSAWPCMNLMPESEVLNAIDLETNAGAIPCFQRPNEPCVCFDGVQWEIADYKEIEEDDHSKPIYSTPTNVQSCATVQECRNLIATKCPEDNPRCEEDDLIRYCESPDLPFYREIEGGYEAYCTHVTGYEQKLVKKLVVDPAKQAAWEAQLDQERQAREARDTQVAAIKQRLRDLDDLADLTDEEVKESVRKITQMKRLLGKI